MMFFISFILRGEKCYVVLSYFFPIYTLNVMPPQNSYVETLTPQDVILGDGPSGGDQILRWSCHE